DAEGDCVQRGGTTYVESITRVRSVDIVLNPATNRGLFESIHGRGIPREIDGLAAFLRSRTLREANAMVDNMTFDPDAIDTPYVDTSSYATAKGNLDQALQDAIGEIVRDSSKTIAERIAAIRKALI